MERLSSIMVRMLCDADNANKDSAWRGLRRVTKINRLIKLTTPKCSECHTELTVSDFYQLYCANRNCRIVGVIQEKGVHNA